MAVWDQHRVRDDLRDYVVEHLGAEETCVDHRWDGCSQEEHGTHTAGVLRQYTGTAGRIESSQLAGYSRRGWPATTSTAPTPGLRQELEQRGVGYVLAVACSHPVTISVEKLPGRRPYRQAARASGSDLRQPGTKGPRFYDWAWIQHRH